MVWLFDEMIFTLAPETLSFELISFTKTKISLSTILAIIPRLDNEIIFESLKYLSSFERIVTTYIPLNLLSSLSFISRANYSCSRF